MAHELDVWLFADRVGTLALVDGRLNFCYAPGWLSHKDTVALSKSLPLQVEPFDDRKTRPFFAGPTARRADAPPDCAAVSGVWPKRLCAAGPHRRRMCRSSDVP
ncbi:MAG: HipA N-terminal domain-containing protein [Methyloversatilis sp.]|nr:HipA N-terminal domain-containing protein [Methyloversatilis sp.]MCR6665757.1 HipA N-terminal domain-containing protein [Methyloversatilis sp.]